MRFFPSEASSFFKDKVDFVSSAVTEEKETMHSSEVVVLFEHFRNDHVFQALNNINRRPLWPGSTEKNSAFCFSAFQQTKPSLPDQHNHAGIFCKNQDKTSTIYGRPDIPRVVYRF